MRVALYARVSTQHDDAVKTQIEFLRHDAAIQAFSIVEGYICSDSGCTGRRLDRPGLSRLRQGAAARAFDGVLLLSPDRLSRHVGELMAIVEELKRSSVHLVSSEPTFPTNGHDASG